MNILVANWQDKQNPQAGGAEIHLFEIYSRLAARGHRVRLVCSGWRGCAPRAVVDGIAVERCGTRHTFALWGRGAFRRALSQEQPEVVVEDINKIPLFLAGLTKLPFLVVVPHLFGATVFQEAPFPMASAVWLAERPMPWLYRRAAFQAISESTRDDLIARGVSPGRIRVVRPGVDSQHYTPAVPPRRSAAPSFLYVGRLQRYKGVETALRALAIARSSRGDLTLEVAGRGDDRPRLEAIVDHLDLAGAVRFLGLVSEADKLKLLRSSWANVFPSSKEGWGITIMEAAACGTPSLASDSPGLRDSVRHGETGFLVPHNDPQTLATKMLDLANDLGLVERLGGAARRYAESHTWGRAAAETEDQLKELLDARASDRRPAA